MVAGCPREWESGYIFRNKEYPINIEIIPSREERVGIVYGVEVEMIDDKGQIIAEGSNNGYYRILGENKTICHIPQSHDRFDPTSMCAKTRVAFQAFNTVSSDQYIKRQSMTTPNQSQIVPFTGPISDLSTTYAHSARSKRPLLY